MWAPGADSFLRFGERRDFYGIVFIGLEAHGGLESVSQKFRIQSERVLIISDVTMLG